MRLTIVSYGVNFRIEAIIELDAMGFNDAMDILELYVHPDYVWFVSPIGVESNLGWYPQE